MPSGHAAAAGSATQSAKARRPAVLLGLLQLLAASGAPAGAQAEVSALVQGSLRVHSHPHKHEKADDHKHHHHDDGKTSGHGGSEEDAGGLRPMKYSALADGDVLAGRLECGFGPVGLRVRLGAFPKSARLEFFPLATYDQNSHMWCRPFTSCASSFNATVTWKSPSIALEPAAGGGADSSCAWQAFPLRGSVSAGDDGLKVTGQLSSSVILGTSLVRRQDAEAAPSSSSASASWLPPKCALFYYGVQQRMPAGTCSSFTATVCRRGAPFEEGDKILYFIRHGEQRNTPDDSNLTALGEKQVHNLYSNPTLARALSNDPSHRAEIVLASPMVRTMHTAVVGFGDLGMKIELDMNLIELANEPTKWEGEAFLQNAGRPELLEQYKSMWRSSEKGFELDWNSQQAHAGQEDARLEERVRHFLAHVRKRPERRIIVVGHNNYMKSQGIYVKGFATMAVRVLGQDGKLRETSPPECWP